MRRLMIGTLAAAMLTAPVQAGIGKRNGEIGFDFGATSFDKDVSTAGVGTATLDFPFANVSDSGTARQIAAGCRFFFGDHKGAAFRLEASQLSENSFDETSTHTSYVVGFTWRLGDGP